MDHQEALRDYIERIKSIRDTEDGLLSEQFTRKLEELYSRISTPDPTTGTATSKFGCTCISQYILSESADPTSDGVGSGGHGGYRNGQQSQVESTV